MSPDAPPRPSSQDDVSAPGVAIAGVIVSMALVAIGNGLMFGYIPVRLGAEGFAPIWAGAILTGLSLGGIAGCLLTGPLVRRVGHARAYMVFSALVVLSNAVVGAGTYPVLWLFGRMLYGFSICAMFIVAQSWLNDAVANRIRGRVMAIFYVCYIVGLGCGSFLLGVVNLDAAEAPLPVAAPVSAAFVARPHSASASSGLSAATGAGARVAVVGVARAVALVAGLPLGVGLGAVDADDDADGPAEKKSNTPCTASAETRYNTQRTTRMSTHERE